VRRADYQTGVRESPERAGDQGIVERSQSGWYPHLGGRGSGRACLPGSAGASPSPNGAPPKSGRTPTPGPRSSADSMEQPGGIDPLRKAVPSSDPFTGRDELAVEDLVRQVLARNPSVIAMI